MTEIDYSHDLDAEADDGIVDGRLAVVALAAPSGYAGITVSGAAPALIPSDSYVNGSNSQWHLVGTWGVRADRVWEDYTGKGIVLAALDDGFQTTHADLSANLKTNLSYNYVSNTTNINPPSASTNHGTAVMGVMVAANNGIGTVGVAYEASGAGIVKSYGSSGNGLLQTLKGFQWAYSKDVDVMNNSWGYTSPFADDFNKVFSGTSFSQVETVMKNMVDNGRDGLGQIIVFSAGNARAEGENTNYHNFQNTPYSITVGAIDSNGDIASFSTPGASILISAGGVGVLTTDRTGSAGYNTNTSTLTGGNYAYMNGTSFSAPTVSGVVGLMLQANGNLGWRDVQEILAYSARHNDANDAGWQYNGATNWNGGGLHFSHDYGYGAADAWGAVRLAETWTLQKTSDNMETVSGGSASPGASVVGGTSSEIVVAQNIIVEHVLVNLNISSAQAGSLVVTLISADGTESVLVNQPGNGSYTGIYGVTGIQFEVSTVASWGEMSAGTWTLEVSGTAGTLNSWSLTFMGAEAAANSVYVYTDSYGDFSGGALSARGTLTDTDGGTDTINLAAVSSDTELNMTDNTDSMVAGNLLHIAAGTIIENAYLGDGDDTVNGNAADNFIYGGRGSNTLDGAAGDDTAAYKMSLASYSITFTSATVVEISYTSKGWTDVASNFEYFKFASVTYTFAQLEAHIALLNSTINGTAGNDTIVGTTGTDLMIGGRGNDTYTVDNTGDVVQEGSAQGTDLVLASVSHTLAANVENLTMSGSGNISATGNSLVNTLTGNSGNNILDGGAGADRMVGGAGNDTYVVDNILDVAIDILDGGTDLLLTSVNLALTSHIENATATGTGAVRLTGNALTNTLTGNSGNNVLNGLSGADTMIGGTGSDSYTVDDTGDVIVENADEGADFVTSSISYTLGSHLEKLTLSGSGNTNGTGNSLDNTLTGNLGNNVLDGGAGADVLVGLKGNDTYIVDNAGDVITEAAASGTDTVLTEMTYTLGLNVENLTLTGTGDVNGTGNTLANVLTGNAGVNTLAGLGGNDTYIIDSVDDVIVEAASAGIDTVLSSISYALGDNLENLTLTGTGNINATGNALNNTLTGTSGNNILIGGEGVDRMIGGAGDDTYYVDNTKDVLVEASSGGTDIVFATASYTIAANIEQLVLQGSDDLKGTGNAIVNTLTGNSGNNVLNGLAGADTMIGGEGNDTYIVDNVSDRATEGADAGTDTVQASVTYLLGDNLENLTLTGTGNINGTGNALANTLTGNAGNNSLNGGAGDDVLNGGLGANTLTGGLGADTFVFVKNATATVRDFSAVDGDKLDISSILTGFSEDSSSIADFLRLSVSAGNTVVSVDTNGATGGARFVVVGTLTGVTGLNVQDLYDDGQIIAATA